MSSRGTPAEGGDPPAKRARRTDGAAAPSSVAAVEEEPVEAQAAPDEASAQHAEVEQPQAEAVGERGGGTASSELAAEAMAAPESSALPPRPEDNKVGPQVQAKLRSLIGFIAGDPDATWGKLLCDTPKVRPYTRDASQGYMGEANVLCRENGTRASSGAHGWQCVPALSHHRDTLNPLSTLISSRSPRIPLRAARARGAALRSNWRNWWGKRAIACARRSCRAAHTSEGFSTSMCRVRHALPYALSVAAGSAMVPFDSNARPSHPISHPRSSRNLQKRCKP